MSEHPVEALIVAARIFAQHKRGDGWAEFYRKEADFERAASAAEAWLSQQRSIARGALELVRAEWERVWSDDNYDGDGSLEAVRSEIDRQLAKLEGK